MRRRELALRSYVSAIAVTLLFTGCFGGGGKRAGRAASDPAYSKMLRARFYEAWVQPEGVTAPRGRIVVPVDVQIDERGRVVRFKIATSSGLRALDESIAAIRGQVKKVDPPPMSLPNGRFDLRINFELDVKR